MSFVKIGRFCRVRSKTKRLPNEISSILCEVPTILPTILKSVNWKAQARNLSRKKNCKGGEI